MDDSTNPLASLGIVEITKVGVYYTTIILINYTFYNNRNAKQNSTRESQQHCGI